MKWIAWLGCVGVALATFGACSSEDDKNSSRGEDGGGAGEAGAPSAAGGQTAPGGEGGMPATPAGGAAGATTTSEGGGGGSGGSAEAGAGGEPNAGGLGGAGGAPAVELSVASLQGTWTGHLISSYVCESAVQDIELSIEGTTVVSNWPIAAQPGTGSIQQQSERAFTFDLLNEDPNVNQNYRSQLFVHPSGNYAFFIAIARFDGVPANNTIVVAILQKAEAAPLEPTEQDFASGWKGIGFELDDDFAVAEEFTSRGTIESSEGLFLDGIDRDGAFSGVLTEEGGGAWVASTATQEPQELGIIALMSDDKQVIALTLLRKLDPDDSALCDLNGAFADMSVHKFALWTRFVD